MVSRITGSATHSVQDAQRISPTGAAKVATPVVSHKPRQTFEQTDKRVDGLYNFLELGAGGANALVQILSSTPAGKALSAQASDGESPDVRQALNKMRFYVTSCMFGSRAINSESYSLLNRFSEMWAQTTVEQRKMFPFGDEFDRFVATIPPPTEAATPTVVVRDPGVRN